MNKIPLIRPYIDQDIKNRVLAVLESGMLTEGEVTRAFEEAVRSFIGCRRALAVTSCTTGLEMALRALEVGPGDEVIVPDYTYPATADAVAIVGATVVIVDVDQETMLIDYDAVERAVTPRTKAVIPVSLFGNPLDYDRLLKIREDHGLSIVEDAACSLGAAWRGGKVGTFSDITVFSLHPRKFITTGEGGIIATDNQAWADWMESYKHFGIGVQDSRLTTSFERIGANYKLSNLLAAVGLGQMVKIDELLDRRLALAQRYREKLGGVNGIKFSRTTEGGTHSCQSFCVLIRNRNRVLDTLRGMGIEVQIGTYSLHMHAAFQSSEYCRISGTLEGSTHAFRHCLTLPLYHDMTEDEQDRVVSELIRVLG